MKRGVVAAIAIAVVACSDDKTTSSSSGDAGTTIDAGGQCTSAGGQIVTTAGENLATNCPAGWTIVAADTNSRNRACCVPPEGGGLSGDMCRAAGGACAVDRGAACDTEVLASKNDCPAAGGGPIGWCCRGPSDAGTD